MVDLPVIRQRFVGDGTSVVDEAKRVSREIRALERRNRMFERRLRAVNTAVREGSRRLLIFSGVAATAFVTGLRFAGEWSAELRNSADQIGISVEQLQLLGREFENVGGEVEDARDLLGTLAERVRDATLGSGELQNSFNILGVELTDAGGNLRSITDLAEDTFQGFQDMENQTEATALGITLFGDSAARLLPLIREQGRELFNNADRLRVYGVETDEANRANVALRRSFGNVGQSLTAFRQNISAAASPILRDEVDRLARVITSLTIPAINAVNSTLEFMRENAEELTFAIGILTLSYRRMTFTLIALPALFASAASGLAAMGDAIGSGDFDDIGRSLREGFLFPMRELGGALSDYINEANRAFDATQRLAGTGFGDNAEFDVIAADPNRITPQQLALQTSERISAGLAQGAPDGARDAVLRETTAIEERIGVREREADAIMAQMEAQEEAAMNLRRTADSIGNAFGQTFADIITGAQDATDAIRSLAASILDAVTQALVVQPIANAISGGITGGIGGTNFPNTGPPGFQRGGRIEAGQLGIVGEAGAELFVPSSAGRIIPNGGFGGATLNQPITISVNSTDGPGVERAINEALPGIRRAASQDALALLNQPGPRRRAGR